MAKMRVTFEVDTIRLFDALTSAGGLAAPLGACVAGTMMTGHTSALDAFCLANHGVVHVETQHVFHDGTTLTDFQKG